MEGMNAVPSTARRSRRLLTIAAATGVAIAAAAPATAAPLPLPEAPNCPVFPADNHWNLKVDRLPVHKNSRRIITSIGRRAHPHNNFGGGTWAGGPDGTPI